jgi:hypothetical protein
MASSPATLTMSSSAVMSAEISCPRRNGQPATLSLEEPRVKEGAANTHAVPRGSLAQPTPYFLSATTSLRTTAASSLRGERWPLSRAVGEETFPSYGSARIAHTSLTLLLTTVMSALPSGSNSKTIGPWINSSEPGPEKSVVPFVMNVPPPS